MNVTLSGAVTLPRSVGQSASKAYTLIWHSADLSEREWIAELFGPYCHTTITDTKREVVIDNSIVCAAFIRTWNPEHYRRFRGKDVLLIHCADEAYEGPYDVYQNFKGVFRNHWSDVFNPKYVKALPLGPSAGTTCAVPGSSRRPAASSGLSPGRSEKRLGRT